MDNRAKIITVWSPIGGAGVTFTAINVARLLAKQNKKIALLDFDFRKPDIALYAMSDNILHSIDNIIPYTDSGMLNNKILESNMQDFEGFKYLRGTSSPEQAQYIKAESLSKIIEVACEPFDYVIVDCNTSIDNAGTYIALKTSDIVLSVIDKNVITIQLYDKIKPLLISNFDIEKFKIVINKCHKEIYMDREEVKNYLQLEVCYEIPSLNYTVINAINQGKLSNLFKGKQLKKYDESVLNILNTLFSEPENTTNKKKGFFK